MLRAKSESRYGSLLGSPWKQQTAALGSSQHPPRTPKSFRYNKKQQTAVADRRSRRVCNQEVAGSSPAGSTTPTARIRGPPFDHCLDLRGPMAPHAPQMWFDWSGRVRHRPFHDPRPTRAEPFCEQHLCDLREPSQWRRPVGAGRSRRDGLGWGNGPVGLRCDPASAVPQFQSRGQRLCDALHRRPCDRLSCGAAGHHGGSQWAAGAGWRVQSRRPAGARSGVRLFHDHRREDRRPSTFVACRQTSRPGPTAGRARPGRPSTSPPPSRPGLPAVRAPAVMSASSMVAVSRCGGRSPRPPMPSCSRTGPSPGTRTPPGRALPRAMGFTGSRECGEELEDGRHDDRSARFPDTSERERPDGVLSRAPGNDRPFSLRGPEPEHHGHRLRDPGGHAGRKAGLVLEHQGSHSVL